jgi:hypothetical protein
MLELFASEPQRSFSSFLYRAHSWSHQQRICYKAEQTAAGTNLRLLVTNLKGRSPSVFASREKSAPINP